MNPKTFVQNLAYRPPKPDEPALHRAVRIGDHQLIRQLFVSGNDINLTYDIRLDPGARETLATPLMVAAGSGDGATAETMHLLLEFGASPLLNFGGGTIARFAAGGLGWNYAPGGDAARLQLCLALGCEVNEIDERGATLLADAAATGDVHRVQVLLEAGATPNLIGSHRKPSSLATIPGSTFDEDAPWSFQIPLHNAVEVDSLDMVSSLIDAGARIDTMDSSKRTALFYARSPEIARLLTRLGLGIETPDYLGWSPLVAAVNDGFLEGVTALLSAGADVNATHDRGFTVFMSAVSTSERKIEIMNALIAAAANPHALTELGWNAFHAAIDVNGQEANSEESIRATFELLRRLGVDINHKDNYGIAPLARAKERGTETEVDVLRQLGAKD